MNSAQLFFQDTAIAIYHADFLTTACVPDASVDLIVTSPP
ncbi:MAG: site-specific DNA-methyltransferase, partial [Chloroflexi bacterium]|nr:site-specific DNA-methyltransferase [Chloroflexota bacterium]